MSAKESKRMWVSCQVDEDAHSALMQIATRQGLHPSKVLEAALDMYILECSKDPDAMPIVRLKAYAIEDRERQSQLSIIKQMAYTHLHEPTDESAERLAYACEIAQISMERLLDELDERPEIASIIQHGGSLSKIQLWLMETMVQGEIYHSKKIIEMGKKYGFKEHNITAAKRELDIESKRMPDGWYWKLPELISMELPKKAKKYHDEEAPF